MPALLFFITRRSCRELQAAERVAATQDEAEAQAERERTLLTSRAPG